MTPIRALCIAGAVFTLSAVTSDSEIPEDELKPLVQRIEPSVVRVHAFRRSESRWYYGSGFFVNDYGEVVTNAHVVRDASYISVQIHNGCVFRVHSVLVRDEENDLALLLADIPHNIVHPLELATELPSAGEEVVLVGSEPLEEREVLSGVVTAVHRIPGIGGFISVRAPIRRGWSGSAVVNTEGVLVGVVAAFLPGEETHFSAAPAEDISALLKRKGLDFFEAGESPFDTSACTAKDLYVGGSLASRAGEYRKAIYFCRLALGKDPGFFDAYVLAAWCHSSLEEPEDAIGMLKHALRERPFDAGVYARLGFLYWEIGNEEMMLDCYEHAVQLEPDDAMNRFWLGRAYAQLGRVYEERGEHGRSLVLYREAVRISPENVTAYLGLGTAYKGLGRYRDAVRVLQEGVRVDPYYSLIHQELAELYEELGDRAGALVEYEEAVRLEPTNGFTRCALGKCYLSYGDLWHALGWYWSLKTGADWLSGFLAEEIFREALNQASE